MRPEDFKAEANVSTTNPQEYMDFVRQSNAFDNTFESILPQTALFDIVNKHFADKSGKAKKAMIFGWDGARADAITLLDQDSALFKIKNKGGLYLAFTGGIPGKKLTCQQTSTAPGWATFVTGKWSSKHTVHTNGGINMSKTFFKTVAKKGYKVKFDYIWPHHTLTYILEKAFAGKRFERLPNPDKKGMDIMDARLKDAILADIHRDVDLVFGIFEAPDSFGHQFGFSKGCPEYMTAIRACDNHAKEIMTAIANRKSIDNEDWLFVVISDHGGIGKNHGSQVVDCRTVFIDINKKLL